MRAVWNSALLLLSLAALLPAATFANPQPSDGLDTRRLVDLPSYLSLRVAAPEGGDIAGYATRDTDATIRQRSQYERDDDSQLSDDGRPAGREVDTSIPHHDDFLRVRKSPPATSAAPTIFGINVFLIIIWLALLYLMFRTGSISSTADGTNYAEELEKENAMG